MDFFTRHLTEPTAIAEEPSLSQVVSRVRETAVCLAVLGQVEHGTRLLSTLHSHGIPPFDLLEKGPEIYTADYAQCQTLAKGGTEHAVPVHTPRSDPFTRIVFAFAWEHVREWPEWATPKPEPVDPAAAAAVAGDETTLDALERYARTLVCNRFAHPWREDLETFELVKGLALRQDNRANPHGPIPVRMHGFWILWERMLAPWPMNQIVKATGRVLTLDLAVRLFSPARNPGRAGSGTMEERDEEDQSEEELIDGFIVDHAIPEKEEGEGEEPQDNDGKSEGRFAGDEYSIEPWGRYIAEQHDAQDQMPMLGSMRALWGYEWFTDPEKNELVKVLEINVARLRDAAEAGCEMLNKRLKHGSDRPYDGCTISGLVKTIDENTRANAKYAPDDAPDRDRLLVEQTALGPVDLDEQKIFRPKTLLRRPAPSYQDIADLEKRLEASDPLPDDYRIFLRTTDGMGPVWWNGSNLLRLLAPIAKVALEEDEYLLNVKLELLPDWGLYGSTSIEWPLLRRAILVSEGGYEGQLYLVEPKYVARAKAAFFRVYESATDYDRCLLRREVQEVYGSLEALRELSWAVMFRTCWFSETIPYRSFGAVLEALAGSSRRTPKEWSLSFDPSTRKLLGIYYRPAAEWDDSKEGRLVQIGKGNLQASGNGTVSMGKLLYPGLGFNMPMVDH